MAIGQNNNIPAMGGDEQAVKMRNSLFHMIPSLCSYCIIASVSL